VSNKPVLQNILKDILHTEDEENNHKHKRSGMNKIQKGRYEPMRIRKYKSWPLAAEMGVGR
jgi:hypothetical protein